MKTLITLIAILLAAITTQAQTPQVQALAKDDGSHALDMSNAIPYLSISGIGHISSQTEALSVDPSANIQFSMSLSETKRWRAYGGYNIGGAIDTTERDSLSLAGIFFPDKSKNGFYMGASVDLLRAIPSLRSSTHHIENVKQISDDKRYYYLLEGYAEYYYLRKQIKDTIAVPRIQNSTWILGLRGGGVLSMNGNSFGLLPNVYYKRSYITDATYETFNEVFKTRNGNKQLPSSASFVGFNLNFQINKTILGFTYEELIGNSISNRDVWGGVFILKASIAADFFNFH